MSTRTGIKPEYQGVQGACPQQAVTSTRGTAKRSEHCAVGAGLKLVYSILIYKETMLSNNLCNRSCKQLSSLYIDLHELHLLETHKHIVNKQMWTCFLLNHKHHTQQPPTLRNLMHTEWGTCDTWDGLMCEHQNKHTHTTLTHFLSLYMHRVSSLRSLGIFIKYSNALS